ncbi:MAG: ABC transporter substrate-binding protein [Candidatus Muiribacteriota bacterium]
MYKISIIFVLVIAMFIAGCGDPEPRTELTDDDLEPNYGDILVQALEGEPVTLNPFFSTDSRSSSVQSDIFDSLVTREKGELVPSLAESWEIINVENVLFIHLKSNNETKAAQIIEKYYNNEDNFASVEDIKRHLHWRDDGTEIIEVIYEEPVDDDEAQKWMDFHEAVVFAGNRYEVVLDLRNDVNWHDGRTFTSGDVIFTFDYYMNPENKNPYIASYYSLKKVEAEGRYKVRGVFYQPMLEIMRQWNRYILPRHLLEDHPDMREAHFNRTPVGTGPYEIEDWNTGEYIILNVNDDYFKGRPYINKKVYRFIPDRSQQFLALINGDIDSMSFSFDQYKNYADDKEFQERFNIFKLPRVSGYNYIGYNMSKKHFDNLKVRKALTLALNLEELNEGVFYGDAERVTGPYRRDSWAYNPNVEPVPYDPERAVELLKEEGYERNSEGYFELDGDELSLTLITNADNNERVHMSRYIQDYWNQIGVRTDVEHVEWSVLENALDTGTFDAAMLGWNLPVTPDIYNVWHSNSIPNEENPYGLNSIHYSNPRVDELIEKIRFTPEIEKAKPMAWEVHEIIASEYGYAFLSAEDNIFVIDTRFHGVEIDGNFLTSSRDWFVPEPLIKYEEGF